MSNKKTKAESKMTAFTKNSDWYLRSIKEPIFLTSTYRFNNALEGEKFFKDIYGGKEFNSPSDTPVIYTRYTYPNQISLEEKFKLWEDAEDSAFFNSGMAAITTLFLAFLKPGSTVLKNKPMYGGADNYLKLELKKWEVDFVEFDPETRESEILEMIKKSGKKIDLIYLETPCNPTNDLIDISMLAEIRKKISAKGSRIPIAVDNTFLGPIGQNPLSAGADLSVYSATKYIGGHGDLIAGAISGKKKLIKILKEKRDALGNMVDPFTAWMLNRSQETLKLRFEQQSENAMTIAKFLQKHSKITRVRYLGLKENLNKREKKIFKKQCINPGAMISFHIKGKKKDAFKFLDSLKTIQLAVSLGGTESNAQHPWSMSHSNVPETSRRAWGVNQQMIRLSVGIENINDLIGDLNQALKKS